MTDLARLQDVLTGKVIEPGMPGYEAVRRPAMARFWHIRPRAVVRCASADDVVQALAFARRTGLRVVPRGGGHCFAGRSSTDGIVLDMTPLRSISISPAGVATMTCSSAQLWAGCSRCALQPDDRLGRVLRQGGKAFYDAARDQQRLSQDIRPPGRIGRWQGRFDVHVVNPPLGSELIHRGSCLLTLPGVIPEIDPPGTTDQPCIQDLLQIRPQGGDCQGSPRQVIDRPHQLIDRIVHHQMIDQLESPHRHPLNLRPCHGKST